MHTSTLELDSVKSTTNNKPDNKTNILPVTLKQRRGPFSENRDTDLESGIVEEDHEKFPVFKVVRSSTTSTFSIALPRKTVKGTVH